MRSRNTRRTWVGLISVMIIAMMFPDMAIEAESNNSTTALTGIESGGTKQNDLFTFGAYVKHDDISDGTAPFDSDNQPGNDSSDHNKIVRSWDTVTYPVKITVNPKNVDKLENIKLKLSGTLENGIVGKRTNAKFAIGGKEDIENKEVSFVQNYTIEQTGNSIMIPVTVEVQGAKPGVQLTPKLQVEVASVDGEKIDDIVTVFDRLPSVTVSSKVNIKPIINKGLGGLGYPYYPHSKLIDGGSEKTGVHAFAISWSVDRLTGKTDMRGATFPDPHGDINYTIEMYGDVYWDNAPAKKGTEHFNFDGRDTPFLLFDHQPIDSVKHKIGSEHTLMDGKSYRYPYPKHYVAANSYMPDFKKSTIERHNYNTVWDSGSWRVSQPDKERSKVIYKGKNTGFMIGSTFPKRHAYVSDSPRYLIYGANDRVFSTHAFIIDMQNEYRVGGPNNPHNYTNNVYYRVNVILDSYTDANDNKTEFNKSDGTSFTIRNGTGGMAAYGTFRLYPGSGYISPKNPYNYNSSVGDGSILLGQDVYFTPRLNPSNNLYGGYKAAYRWNTDAFELTKSYAEIAERNIFARGYRDLTYDWVKNDKEHQTVYYGVAKFSDNSFRNFTDKGTDDYNWYDTYDEAAEYGPVGAMQSDIHAAIGGMKGARVNIPLHVKNDNIGFGSETKDGTPVIAVINATVYYDDARTKTKDVTKNRSYNNYSKWDDAGNLLDIQSPVGGGVNFDTLAIVPAKTATTLKADKDTYYNSETIHWTAKSSIVLPEFGVPDNVDSGVTITQTLPRGLDYKTGSGRIDGVHAEPEIIANDNDTTKLVWELLISNKDQTIPNVTFATTINPFALTSNSVQSGVTVSSVIESELDGGPVDARTATKTVTILKVGMVGIYESIDKTFGYKNSDYTVTLSPYTTIEDEKNVTGLTHLPLTGDDLGSDYHGIAILKAIHVTAEREHDDKDVKIYLNNEPIHSDKPNEIDVSDSNTDGWYEYTGGNQDVSQATSLLFIVDGKMTNTDAIQIDLTMQTNNNEFGDMYLNNTVINSATDYNLSPISNKVRYTIRADLELVLERFQIYTNKASAGLPVSVRVKQRVINEDRIKDEPIILAIYETESGDKVVSKMYKQHELERENELTIPSDTLEKDGKKNYEVRIQGVDETVIWVKDGEGEINTDGYTAKEKILMNDDADEDGDINYKGVVMTERELGGAIIPYYETLKINKIAQPKVKSGYGFVFKPKVAYTNELMNQTMSKVGIKNNVDATMTLDNALIDDSLAYYDVDSDTSVVPMEQGSEEPGATSMNITYRFPRVYLGELSGEMYTSNQKENDEIDGLVFDGGYKVYVPVWIDALGNYGAEFKSEAAIGSNFMQFDLYNNVNVYAYMFSHTDSDTPIKDELLIIPAEQENIPFD